MKLYVDLHLHSTYSDGNCPPKQLAIDCAMIGMDAISLTDHDSTKGYNEIKNECKKWDLEIITGVEITTKKYHILGYNFDIKNKQLQDFLKYSRDCQAYNIKNKVKKLQEYGMPITFEKVKKDFPDSRLGKVNLWMSILMDEECRKFNNGLNSMEVFLKYLKKGGMTSNLPSKGVGLDEAISQIHNANGVAVIAHPSKDVDTISELEELLDKGIDGIEFQPNYGQKSKRFGKYAKKHNILLTYGSDFHGARLLGRGLLERDKNLIEKFW
ncbi:MAG: PHP domain-containing protein [Nanoarchaeota archaeon]|nr:PHP domain-containing protein [Nanoarchaeota archaeon]MCG2718083.1 PHP domain-containing protein [Nanoarchaeota archaeon]